MNLLPERIKLLRTTKGLTQRALADQLDVSLHTVLRWENDMRQPDSNYLKTLASVLDTSVAYLIGETDDPHRYTTLLTEDENATGNPPETRKPIKREQEVVELKDSWEAEFVKIPVYDIRTCAGFGSSHFFEEAEVIAERLLPTYRVGAISVFDDRKPFITQVDGDSMSEAGIRDRDEIVVNPAEDVHSGDAALVCFGPYRDTAVKWVYFLPGGAIELRSATPGFPNMHFTKEQQLSEDDPLTIIGRVMAYTGVPKRG